MKGLLKGIAIAGFAIMISGLPSCNDRGNTTDNSSSDTKDTNLTDSRRYSTDTVNYLTKDSANKSQDVVDPNPPGDSH